MAIPVRRRCQARVERQPASMGGTCARAHGLEASIVTATVALEKSPSGTRTVPDQRANAPRTFAVTRCRTEKCRLEWLLSISQRSVLISPPGAGPVCLNAYSHKATAVPGPPRSWFQSFTWTQRLEQASRTLQMIGMTL